MTVTNLLGQLESAQLIRRSDEPEISGAPGQSLAYVFKHSMTQETAYESLLLKRRREIHRRVAECIEQLEADRLDEYAALLAKHFAEAGDDAKTLEYATRAGQAAMRIYANVEAVADFSLALDVTKRMSGSGRLDGTAPIQDLYLKRGRALELLSRFDDASHNYDEMEAAAVEYGDRAFQLAALIASATIRAIPGSARDPAESQVLSDRALGLARELGDRKAEAKILWNLLLLNIYSGGDAHQAVAYGEESLAIARELNLREQMAFTLHDLFVAYAYLGEMEKARETRLEASKIWRELDNQPMLAESLSGLSLLHYFLGDPDRGITLAQEAYQISLSIGNLGGQGFSGYVLGLIYADRGDINRAIESFEDAIPITRSGGLEGNGISPYATLGFLYADTGDTGRGLDLIRGTFQRASAKLPLQRMWLYAIMTRAELLAGDVGAAGKAFHDGQVDASLDNFSRTFPAGAPQLYFSACENAIAQQDYVQAVQIIDSLIAHLQDIKMKAYIPEALFLKGQALCAGGQNKPGADCLRTARAEANTMGLRRVLWRILLALSRYERLSGNEAEADDLLVEARGVVDYISAHAPAELRASFLGMPDVRSILGQ